MNKDVYATMAEKLYTALSGYFRMSSWGLVAAAALVAVYLLMPQEIEVGLWKATLVFGAAYVGYFLDRTLFPYARPHANVADATDGMWNKDDPQGHVFVGSMVRRALVVVGTMIAFGMAL